VRRCGRPRMPQMMRPTGVDSPSCWRGTVATKNSQPGQAVSGVVVSTSQVRRLAKAAYLARFNGQSRIHTESDRRCYLSWCESHDLDLLAATRPAHRALRPLAAGNAPVPALDGLAPHVRGRRVQPDLRDRRGARALTGGVRQPAERARRLPTLGLTHLQFEALVTTAKHSTNPPATSRSSPCSACWDCAS
jgi:integrase/recombinase XerD